MRASVFIAWDEGIPDLAQVIDYFLHGIATRDFVRALGTDELAQGVIPALVREEIAKSDRFVAFVDQPNIQVGFEIGYALGLGKPVLLARLGEGIGGWLARPPLAGLLVPRPRSICDARDLLFERAGHTVERPRRGGHAVGGACFGESLVADVFREALAAGCPGLTLLPEEGLGLRELPAVFEGWGFFALALPAPAHGARKPDLDASAAAAVFAGYAAGIGLEVRVLRTDAHRRLEDVEDLTRVIARSGSPSIEERAREVAAWAELSRVALEADALTAWRAEQHLAHARLLPPFLPKTDRPEVEHVYVELEVAERLEPGGCDDGDARGGRAAKRRGGAIRLADRYDNADGPAGRWLVFGEPGAGKSTSARHLVYSLCDPHAPLEFLPIFASLNALVDAGGDPFRLAARRLREANAAAAERLPGMLRDHAGAGRVLFLLDGLDEVADERRASDALRVIRALGADWPLCPLLVFTRHAGARMLTDAPGGAERPFLRAEIRPLTPEKQRDMLVQWLGRVKGAEAAGKVDQRPSLREVVTNPLMLALVATLVMRRQELPPSRVTLYERAIEVLLGAQHKGDAGAEAATAADFAAFDAVSLALQCTGEDWWSTEQIEAVVRAAGVEDAAGWLDGVARKSGLLARHDGHAEPWRYMHRSFRELMAAREMARRPEPRECVPFPESDPGKNTAARQAWAAFSGAWGEPLALRCGVMGAARPGCSLPSRRATSFAASSKGSPADSASRESETNTGSGCSAGASDVDHAQARWRSIVDLPASGSPEMRKRSRGCASRSAPNGLGSAKRPPRAEGPSQGGHSSATHTST